MLNPSTAAIIPGSRPSATLHPCLCGASSHQQLDCSGPLSQDFLSATGLALLMGPAQPLVFSSGTGQSTGENVPIWVAVGCGIPWEKTPLALAFRSIPVGTVLSKVECPLLCVMNSFCCYFFQARGASTLWVTAWSLPSSLQFLSTLPRSSSQGN